MTRKSSLSVVAVEDTAQLILEVVEMPGFSRDARSVLPDEELGNLCFEVATLRQLGQVIPGTGGLRKFRWAVEGRGKRGGARVIYYYGGDHMPVFLIAIYTKSEKVDLTAAQKRAATKLVAKLNEEYRGEKLDPAGPGSVSVMSKRRR